MRIVHQLILDTTYTLWTLLDLSKKSTGSSPTLHKLKHRLINIGVLKIAKGTKTKFVLTRHGEQMILDFLSSFDLTNTE